MRRRSTAVFLTATCVAAFLAAPGAVGAEERGAAAGGAQPPFDLADPAKIEAGSRLFRANCTHYCHNPEGRAARTPALRARTDLSTEFIYKRITTGAPPMPAFGSTLTPEQIWSLVAFIESLAKAQD